MGLPWATDGDRVKCLTKAGLGPETPRTAAKVNHY